MAESRISSQGNEGCSQAMTAVLLLIDQGKDPSTAAQADNAASTSACLRALRRLGYITGAHPCQLTDLGHWRLRAERYFAHVDITLDWTEFERTTARRLALPYAVHPAGPMVVVEVPDLPGFSLQAATLADAREQLGGAVTSTIRRMIDKGLPPVEPRTIEEWQEMEPTRFRSATWGMIRVDDPFRWWMQRPLSA